MAGSIESKPTIEEIKRKLEEQRKQIGDLHIPYARASTFLDQFVQKNFKEQGGKVGGWAPFAASTLARMAKTDPKRMPAKLLQNTGRLRLSFLPFAHKDDAGIGSGLPYSKSHQEGIGHLPQRRMLPTKEMVGQDIERIFNDYTVQVISK